MNENKIRIENKREYNHKYDIPIFITTLVFFVIIASTLRSIITPNAETLTFTKLLQILIEIQNYQINLVSLGDFTILGDWGIFEGLRMFINSIMSIINLGVWLCQSLINVLITVLRFVQILIFSN